MSRANNQDNEHRCYKCNKTEHIMADCIGHPNVQAYAEKTCYKCEKKGHIARFYTMDRKEFMKTQTCNRCGQKRNYRVDCPERLKRSSVNAADTRTCYRWCNQPGHIARDCTGIEIKKLEIDSGKVILFVEDVTKRVILYIIVIQG